MGQAASKANSRRKASWGGVIKSERAQAFEEACLWQLKKLKAPIQGDVRLVCRIFYASRRPDLDESLVKDALQKAGVLVNDRQIKKHVTEWALDPAKPRVELALTTWTPAKDFNELLEG